MNQSFENFSDFDISMMKIALEEARKAIEHGDVPVGAVLVDQRSGEVIATCHNTREREGTTLGHAEMSVISEACKILRSWRLSDYVLYVTLEPCPMCAGAIMSARIPRVVFGAHDAVAGAMGSVWSLNTHPVEQNTPFVSCGCLENESKQLLRDFFRKRRG